MWIGNTENSTDRRCTKYTNKCTPVCSGQSLLGCVFYRGFLLFLIVCLDELFHQLIVGFRFLLIFRHKIVVALGNERAEDLSHGIEGVGVEQREIEIHTV